MTMADKPMVKLTPHQQPVALDSNSNFGELNLIYCCSTMRHPQASVSVLSLTIRTFVVCFCFVCHVFFCRSTILLIYCIHILYKNQHFTRFGAFFAYTTVRIRVCFVSNYFTINFQMHLYNARFAWASLHCFYLSETLFRCFFLHAHQDKC